MSRKIGALWKHKDKNGQTYLTGTIEIIPGIPTRISVLKNTRKQEQKSNAPDWNIVVNDKPKEKVEKKIIQNLNDLE